MNKMIENEMNSMEFQEEEAPLFDFKQLWMLSLVHRVRRRLCVDCFRLPLVSSQSSHCEQ